MRDDDTFEATVLPEAAGPRGDAAPVPPADALAGRYVLGPLLGRGGSGQVHRAEDRLTGETVAIKFVRSAGQPARRQLRRELTALRLLDLPGVVRLRDDGEDDGQTFLVMDLLPGGPITRLSGPWDRVATPVQAILETLARVHLAGVVHRDLKPGNILLDASDRPVLTDFGLAQGRAVEPPTDGLREGTPRYVAPEQWRGAPCDARADLYAMGAVICELLVGRELADPRLAHEDLRGLRARALRASPTPGRVVDTVLAMLAPDPRDRPGSAQEVLAAMGVPVSLALPDLPPGPDDGALVALFSEPASRFLHVAEDAAALVRAVCDRTGDPPGAVLLRWVRAGHARWGSGRVRVDHQTIAALRWEEEGDARRLARLGRVGSEGELVEAALEAAQAAHDAGSPARAIALLDSVASLVEDPVHAKRIRIALACEALALSDDLSLRRALVRAQRADDLPLVRLLQGARLCAAGEMARALRILGQDLESSEPLRVWRTGLVAHALGRIDPAAQARWLAEVEPWCRADPHRYAKWLGWAGTASYAAGDFETALARQERAAALWSERPVERLAALTNGASAALEVPALARAEALAHEAASLARRLRHPLLEARATWLHRTAAYRAGRDLAPDPELADAGRALSRLLEGQLAMVEAAFAWRRGDDPVTRSLAERAAAAFELLGFHDGRALALALAVAAGAQRAIGPAGEALLRCRDPSVMLQVVALAPALGTEGADAWRASWHLDATTRADVLSLDECRARLATARRRSRSRRRTRRG